MDNRKYVYHSEFQDINTPLPAPLITASDKDELQRRASADAETFTPPQNQIESKHQEIEMLHQRFNKYVDEITSDSLYFSTEILRAKMNRKLTKPELETVDVIQLFKKKIVELKEDASEKITAASQQFQSQVEQARTQFADECAAHIRVHADTYNNLAFLKNVYVYILQEAARQFAEVYKDKKSNAFLKTELGSILRLFEVDGVTRISFDLRGQEYKPEKVCDWLNNVSLGELQGLFANIMEKGSRGKGYTYDDNFGTLYRFILKILNTMNYEKSHPEYFVRTKTNCLVLTPAALDLERAAKKADELKIDAARKEQQLEKLSLRQNFLIGELQPSIDKYTETAKEYAAHLKKAAETVKQTLERDSRAAYNHLDLSLQIAENELQSNDIDNAKKTLEVDDIAGKLAEAKENFGGGIYDSLQIRLDKLNEKIKEAEDLAKQHRQDEIEEQLRRQQQQEQKKPDFMLIVEQELADHDMDVESDRDSDQDDEDVAPEPDNKTVQRYRQETEKYLKYLEQEIRKDYSSGDIQTLVHCCNDKNNRAALVSDKGEVFVEAVEKYNVMVKLNRTLNTKTNAERVDSYHQILRENRHILTKRRDDAFMTFAKGLGVVGATILGLALCGVGSIYTGYKAYQALFGLSLIHI